MALEFYGTVADADSFFSETDLDGTWATFSATDKEKALKVATRKIEELPFAGEKHIHGQTLEFPRIVLPPNKPNIIWDIENDGDIVVPRTVIEATYLQAKFELELRQAANAGINQVIKAQALGITRISVGGTSESYDLKNKLVNDETGLITIVERRLEPYLQTGW